MRAQQLSPPVLAWVEASGVEATTGAVTTETSGVAAIAGVEAGAAVAKAIAGDGVALADGDSTEMPAAAGAAGRSSGRAEVPVAFAFETMTSAGVGFTTASLAFGPAAKGFVRAPIAFLLPFSPPRQGSGWAQSPGPMIRFEWKRLRPHQPRRSGLGDETTIAFFSQPRS